MSSPRQGEDPSGNPGMERSEGQRVSSCSLLNPASDEGISTRPVSPADPAPKACTVCKGTEDLKLKPLPCQHLCCEDCLEKFLKDTFGEQAGIRRVQLQPEAPRSVNRYRNDFGNSGGGGDRYRNNDFGNSGGGGGGDRYRNNDFGNSGGGGGGDRYRNNDFGNSGGGGGGDRYRNNDNDSGNSGGGYRNDNDFGGSAGRGRGRGRRSEGYNQGGSDWTCEAPQCGFNNFSRRTECFKCKASKPAGQDAGESGGGGGSGSGGGWGRGHSNGGGGFNGNSSFNDSNNSYGGGGKRGPQWGEEDSSGPNKRFRSNYDRAGISGDSAPPPLVKEEAWE